MPKSGRERNTAPSPVKDPGLLVPTYDDRIIAVPLVGTPEFEVYHGSDEKTSGGERPSDQMPPEYPQQLQKRCDGEHQRGSQSSITIDDSIKIQARVREQTYRSQAEDYRALRQTE